jgi:hypothetical protein
MYFNETNVVGKVIDKNPWIALAGPVEIIRGVINPLIVCML